MTDPNPDECARGRSDWGQAKPYYDNCLENIQTYSRSIDGDKTYLERQGNVLKEINGHLYYLNEQVDDKKHRITDLEQAQNAAAEQSERDRLESELTTLRYELDGLEREREVDKARREDVGGEIESIQSRLSDNESELDRNKLALDENYRKMVAAHAIMVDNCDPGDVPALP